jgi:hypothetical protein
LSDSARLVSIPRSVAADRTLQLYFVVDVLMVLGILGLIGYSVSLGPLNGPGVQESFGIAVALMFIMGAIVAHTVDMTYRAWPLGRRVATPTPRVISDVGIAFAIKAVIVIAVVLAVAYILGSLIGF